jgi:hypothetical protein
MLRWAMILVGCIVLAAVADAVTIKTGPNNLASAQFTTVTWNTTGATDGGQVVGPSNRAGSDTFVVESDVSARTYVPAGRSYRLIRFSGLVLGALDAANEKCTFSLTKDGSTLEAWSAIEAGDAGSPVCEFENLTGGELKSEGDVCTRVDSTGTLVAPGEYWQVISNDRSGGTDCESVRDIGFEITADLS